MPEYEESIKELLDSMPLGLARRESNGEAVSKVSKGYKPDRTYLRRNRLWVIEIEGSTSRKGFIGGYLKAQKYFQDEYPEKGRLLFTINEESASVDSIKGQILQYHRWLRSYKIPVQPTYLISEEVLRELADDDIEIFSAEFLAKCEKIHRQ